MVSVLIVEDNDQMRSLIRRMVAGVAGRIHLCADGAEALAAVAAHRPDWVLMDLAMPRVDGMTALRRIKAAFPSSRVLIVTQYDDARMRRAAQEAGADGYVLKEDLAALPRALGSSSAPPTSDPDSRPFRPHE
jgi:CheY-like chemotaxis protein